MIKFNPTSYVDGLRLLNRRIQARMDERLKMARSLAQKLAVTLGNEPGVKKVILFGSVAAGTVRNLHFDLDLAVEGGDLWKLMKHTEGLGIDVDLIDLEAVPEGMRQGILARGVVLFPAASL